MEEKQLILTVFGIITVIGLVGIIMMVSTAKTGLVYGRIGGFQRGLAIRTVGSGVQTSVDKTSKGVFQTVGESQSPSAQSKHVTPRIPGPYDQCMPLDENGKLQYDANGLVIVGWERAREAVSKITILKCTDKYFKDVGYPFPNHMCCINRGHSSLVGSTGVAYYVR